MRYISTDEYGSEANQQSPGLRRMFGAQQPIQANFPGTTPYGDTPQYMPPQQGDGGSVGDTAQSGGIGASIKAGAGDAMGSIKAAIGA